MQACIPGIDHQIHDDLFQLTLIHLHQARVVGIKMQEDVLAQQRSEQRRKVGDGAIDIQDLGLAVLFRETLEVPG